MGSYNARKRKVKKTVPTGQVHIQSTFNNTIITVTGLDGNVISWASAGTLGIKGSKKVAYDMGMRTVDVFVKGLGAGRETAIRSLATVGLEVKTITDVTPIPHNGCRPPKRRRP